MTPCGALSKSGASWAVELQSSMLHSQPVLGTSAKQAQMQLLGLELASPHRTLQVCGCGQGVGQRALMHHGSTPQTAASFS